MFVVIWGKRQLRPIGMTDKSDSGCGRDMMNCQARASIRKNAPLKRLDCRVKPGNDDRQSPPILQTIFHSSAVTGCTDRREYFTSAI